MAVENSDILDQWKGCFEFVYGASIEEMAEKEKDEQMQREEEMGLNFKQ